MLRLIPEYLDREAFTVTRAALVELLQLSFETVVHTDVLPPTPRVAGMRVIECESGLNLLCHLDGSAAVQQCATVIAESEASADPQAKLDLVFILVEKVEELSDMLHRKTGQKVKVGTPGDGLAATRKSRLLIVPVTSTEEAILTLQAW